MQIQAKAARLQPSYRSDMQIAALLFLSSLASDAGSIVAWLHICSARCIHQTNLRILVCGKRTRKKCGS